MPLFNTADRNQVHDFVLKMTQADNRVTGGAVVGSLASKTQDEWSDLDLTFGVKAGTKPLDVLRDWTEKIEEEYEVVHHFDVPSGGAIYRVFLFKNGLELDLSAVPSTEYGAKAPHFKLLFGQALQPDSFPKSDASTLIGWIWHHILHANSAINRGKLWQAEYWITHLRHHLLSLKCIREGLPSAHGRGTDQLTQEKLAFMQTSLIQSLEVLELRRTLNLLTFVAIQDIELVDQALSEKLDQLFQKTLHA